MICDKGVAQPNVFSVPFDVLREIYNTVYKLYSNKTDRVVMRPNINHDAGTVLLIGRSFTETFPSESTQLAIKMGDETSIQSFGDGTIIGALVDLYSRLNGLSFNVDKETGILQAIYDDGNND